MDIRTSLNRAALQLQPKHLSCAADGDIGLFEAEILLGHILRKDRAWLLAHNTDHISSTYARQFNALVKRRAKHEPIAYIVGYREFYGRRFFVNKHVLVPRPETELLIEAASLSIHEAAKHIAIWDVGTGSGAIAVTLASTLPTAHVLATDVSAHAISVAKKNAKAHKTDIAFLKNNLLQKPSYRWLKKHASSATHLIICANLPYLPTSDKKKLAQDVVKFEPSKALFSGVHGNDLILRLMGQLSRHLSEFGYMKTTLLFEFDSPQAKALQAAAKKFFPRSKIKIYKDLAKRNRTLLIDIGADHANPFITRTSAPMLFKRFAISS